MPSFTELTRREASALIDELQAAMGQPITPSAPRARRRLDRERAQAAGTDGRRGNAANVTTIVSAEELARITDACRRLGWDDVRFNVWLRSPASPLRHRGDPEIRTLADANRVWWALKNMLRHRGKWRDQAKAQ